MTLFSSVSIVDFEQVNVRNVSAIVLVFLLLTLNIFTPFSSVFIVDFWTSSSMVAGKFIAVRI